MTKKDRREIGEEYLKLYSLLKKATKLRIKLVSLNN